MEKIVLIISVVAIILIAYLWLKNRKVRKKVKKVLDKFSCCS
jgi:preprotein translocase subunit YajC